MTTFQKRLVAITVFVLAVLAYFVGSSTTDPCVQMRQEREDNSTVLATLDRSDSELASYVMSKNAAIYDEMQRQGCKP